MRIVCKKHSDRYVCWNGRNIYLTDVSVSRYQGPSGIISLHYYLQGTDNEEKTKRLEISSQEYEQYKNIRNVCVEYYPRTKRVVQIRIGE